jgi:cbb3-type cytochrome oxidase maturation protein
MWINGLLLTAALLLTAVAIAVFVYATRVGQFEDVEEAKFTMLRSEEPRRELD